MNHHWAERRGHARIVSLLGVVLALVALLSAGVVNAHQSLLQQTGGSPTAASNTTVAASATAGVDQSQPQVTPAVTATDTSTVTPVATATVDQTQPQVTPAATATNTGTSLPAVTATDTGGATPTPTATAAASDDLGPAVTFIENPRGGPNSNIVRVENHNDNRLRVRGTIQLNHIHGPNVQPVNYAEAFGSCTGCQTFAVALQIDLVNPDATDVAPQNVAAAINYHCNGCTTVARALQYVVPVDDQDDVPDNIRQLIDQMNDQIESVAHDRNVTQADQAEATINSVIAQFSDLAQSLYDQRDESTDYDTPGH